MGKITDQIEDLFIKYLWVLCIVMSIFFAIAYNFGYIKNLRSTMPNVIMFSSIIFVVISFILTLLISLEESLLFKRIKDNFPNVTNDIYLFLNRIIFSSIFVVLLALFITVLPANVNGILKIIILLIGFASFWYMVFGAMYMLKYTTDMVLRNANLKKTKKIQ
jgi:hypothetical protein